MSSAKDRSEIEYCRMSVVRDFVYKMKRIGPRTDPCGTPKLSLVGLESLLLSFNRLCSVGKVGSEPV